MAREIYTRDETAAKFQYNILEVSDEISMLLLQIENVLFTKKRSVLGMYDFGIDLESLLFSINYSEGIINSKVQEEISAYCSLSDKYSVKTETKFIKGTNRDIGLIEIYIDGRKSLSFLM